MDWVVPYSLGKATKLIRKFLIDVASSEDEIAFRGLHITRKLDDFESATAAMDEFHETFSTIKRNIANIDKETYLTLDSLEKESLLVDQISLINLKLQMSRAPAASSFMQVLARSFTQVKFFSTSETKRLFGEENMSIERTILNCDKLISTLKIIEEILRHREELDDEIFKPSRIKESIVVELIDKVSEQIDNSSSLNYETKRLINSYLVEIKAEAQSKIPKWQNIIGSLMIVAALTSGLADAPGAAQGLQSLIQYIVRTSVVKPEQPSMPALTEDKHEDIDFFTGVPT